jgi:hypothetical protein
MVHTLLMKIYFCVVKKEDLLCKYLQTELQHQPVGGIQKEILMLGVFELML